MREQENPAQVTDPRTRQIQDALLKLNPKQRAALVLTVYEEMNHAGSRPRAWLLGNNSFVARLHCTSQIEKASGNRDDARGSMTDKELDRLLKSASPPKWSDAHWETFPEKITTALRWGSKSFHRNARDTTEARPIVLSWGVAVASLCGVIALAMGLWNVRVPKTQIASIPDSLALSAKLIRETLAMFPNRVRAIVSDENGLNVQLSDHDDVSGSSAPLYVHVCDGRHCSSFVTFSGQEIQAAEERITVLSDGQGGVAILTSDQFVWSNEEPLSRSEQSCQLRSTHNLGKVM